MIRIHYDFTDGTEVSYAEGELLGDNFTTNCLTFFNNEEEVDDVVIVSKDGSRLSREVLMSNNHDHTSKHMRAEHNIYKMFIANAFTWLKEDIK